MENLWMNLAKLRSQRKECVRSFEWMIVVLRCWHAVRSNFSLIFDILHGLRRWQCWTTLEKMRFYQIYIKLLLRHLFSAETSFETCCVVVGHSKDMQIVGIIVWRDENMRNEWDFHAKIFNTTKKLWSSFECCEQRRSLFCGGWEPEKWAWTQRKFFHIFKLFVIL